MNILEQIQLCTVRIEAILPSGGIATGTGFIHKFDLRNNGLFCPAIVTNKHVLEGAERIRVPINLTNKKDGDPIPGKFLQVELALSDTLLFNHPNPEIDLCALLSAPIMRSIEERGKHPVFVTKDKSILADEDFFQELLPLETVTMIGYPNGIWDSTNNTPIARQGVIATFPWNDYQGRPEFVIDMACFPGSSGSPVFVANFGNYTPRSGGIVIGNRIRLLGILYAGPQHTASGEIEIRPIPVSSKPVPVTRIPNNLGYIIKATQLNNIETLVRENTNA